MISEGFAATLKKNLGKDGWQLREISHI